MQDSGCFEWAELGGSGQSDSIVWPGLALVGPGDPQTNEKSGSAPHQASGSRIFPFSGNQQQ